MKDKFNGKIISGFVGLKLKMYSLIDVDNDEKKSEGVNKKSRTFKVSKYFLSCFDDSLVTYSLAYLHKDINLIKKIRKYI